MGIAEDSALSDVSRAQDQLADSNQCARSHLVAINGADWLMSHGAECMECYARPVARGPDLMLIISSAVT